MCASLGQIHFKDLKITDEKERIKLVKMMLERKSGETYVAVHFKNFEIEDEKERLAIFRALMSDQRMVGNVNAHALNLRPEVAELANL